MVLPGFIDKVVADCHDQRDQKLFNRKKIKDIKIKKEWLNVLEKALFS